MRRENLAPVRPGLAPLLAVVFLALPLQACLEPTSMDCGPDLACPAGYRCSADRQVCIKGNCGDGIVQEGEVCDDGNLTDGDGCNRTCASNETCDNGYVDTIKGEKCDDGDNAAPGGCSVGCRSKETCGNGILDFGEECDDGNTSDADNCLNSCLLSSCGDEKVDGEAPRIETCDTGGESASCNVNCTPSRCGDGIVNVSADEECDDGNLLDTDNCLTTCKLAACGDGLVDGAEPRIEVCDPGGESADCNLNCTLPTCGDGIVNVSAREECDDGNTDDTDNCLTTCKLATCGDGQVDNTAPRIEVCDPGVDPRTCNSNCTPSRCGDRIVNVNAGEECDDGNTNDDDSCLTTTCKHTPPDCGNGFEQWGEDCDDGNTDACGTCNATCTKRQDNARATGKLTTVAGSLIEDGEILSIHDGFKRLTFEFDKNATLNVASRIRISIGYSDSAGDVASHIESAINGSRTSKEFKLFADRTSNEVRLQNDDSGSFGNKDIITSIETAGFESRGMSGGRGYDCPKDMGCTRDEDCDRNLDLKCLPTSKGRKTCQVPPK